MPAVELPCAECGGRHDLAEISFAAAEPPHWHALSDADRARSQLSRDQCEIVTDTERAFFVAAQLPIPVHGGEQDYHWGVWVSLSERSYTEMNEHWEDPGRTGLGPYFGWLCTSLPGYPETMYLKTMVHQREVGLRPVVELEPTEHPLAVHQRDGIDPAELLQLLHAAMGDDVDQGTRE